MTNAFYHVLSFKGILTDAQNPLHINSSRFIDSFCPSK